MLELIESIKDYSVLFIGDTIIDEYQYVEPLGKSPKENIIPVRALTAEWFDGGVHAAAAHLKTFCKSVEVMTGPPGVRKVRFVDQSYTRKISEVHYGCDVKQTASDFKDITVVADFGGYITKEMIDKLCYQAPYLAVNAQTNSSNIGFNLITKYPRADYVVIDEPEARLAAADKRADIEDVILRLAVGHFNRMVVTLGKEGAMGWDKDSGFHYCSAFENRPLDTMGAGDAFFAITAPMSKHGDMDDILKIGNAAGAIKTGIVGHRESVTKENLIKFLEGK